MLKRKKTGSATALVDPVCGMRVTPETAKGQTLYKGQKIYFCSQGCLETYLSAPRQFAVNPKKGWWRRYLERLDKAISDHPPQCRG